MENSALPRPFALLLAARVHVVALFVLSYFVICVNTDGGVSRAEYLAGAGFALLLVLGYLLNKLHDRAEDALNGETPMPPALLSPAAGFLVPAAFLAVCAALYAMEKALLWALVYSAAAAFAYGHPSLRLKGMPAAKPLVNTANFFVVSFMVPFLLRDPGAWAYAPQLAAAAWRMLLAVLSLTLLFDVRDMEGDSAAGLRTLPVLLGRVPVAAAVALAAVALAGVDLTRGVYLSAGNQLALAAFSIGALWKRSRRYYDWLVFAELLFLVAMLVSA